MSRQLEKYLSLIPEDFEQIIKSLSNKLRYTLCYILINRGPLSFSKLNNEIKIKNSMLVNHIKKLELAGLIQHYLKKRKGVKETSFYKITKMGKLFIENISTIYNSEFNTTDREMKFTNEIPDDFIEILKNLSNKMKYCLLLVMIDNDKLSFSEIKKFLGKTNGTIAIYLKNLETSGLIENFYKKIENVQEYSFYRITDMGKSHVTNAYQTYNFYYNKVVGLINAQENTQKREKLVKPMTNEVN